MKPGSFATRVASSARRPLSSPTIIEVVLKHYGETHIIDFKLKKGRNTFMSSGAEVTNDIDAKVRSLHKLHRLILLIQPIASTLSTAVCF